VINLGSWVGTQRAVKDSLPPERKQRLDDIGFIWDPHAEAWKEGFAKLLQFKEREGHCSVPTGLIVDEFKLGVWNRNQRKTKDSMSPERKQRLDNIGFIWAVGRSKI
jgi:hypothetical protein